MRALPCLASGFLVVRGTPTCADGFVEHIGAGQWRRTRGGTNPHGSSSPLASLEAGTAFSFLVGARQHHQWLVGTHGAVTQDRVAEAVGLAIQGPATASRVRA